MTEPDAPEFAGTPTHPRRRTAVRVVLGLVAVGGMSGGWAAMARQRARGQSEAIEAVRRAGGRVYLDYQWANGTVSADAPPTQARWVRRLLGSEMLDRAVAVDLRGVPQSAELIRCLLLMPYLKSVAAGGASWDDAALAQCSRLAGLTHLDLSGSEVTDGGLERLLRLKQLTHLSLAATGLSDRSVNCLGRLRTLRRLDLSATGVSDGALQQLAAMLPRCHITPP